MIETNVSRLENPSAICRDENEEDVWEFRPDISPELVACVNWVAVNEKDRFLVSRKAQFIDLLLDVWLQDLCHPLRMCVFSRV